MTYFQTLYLNFKGKINNLRTYFSRELAKTKEPASGSGTNTVYESKWPHFNALMFLRDTVVPRKTTSSLLVSFFIQLIN